MRRVRRSGQDVNAGRGSHRPSLLEVIEELLDRRAERGQGGEVRPASADGHVELAHGETVDGEPLVIAKGYVQLPRDEPVHPLRADVRVDVRHVVGVGAAAAGDGNVRDDLPLPLRVQVVEHGVEAVQVLLGHQVRVVPRRYGVGGRACGEGEYELLRRVRVRVLASDPEGQVEYLRVDEQVSDRIQPARGRQSGDRCGVAPIVDVHQVLPGTLLGQDPFHVRAAAPSGDDRLDPELLLPELGDRAEVASRRPAKRHGDLTLFLRGCDQLGPLGLEQGGRVRRCRRRRVWGRRGCWRRCRRGCGISATGRQE